MKIDVNNQELNIIAPGDTPLLWVLRDELKMRGTKFGCGKGMCGACTVHMDGVAIRSCVFPVSAVQGKITTIEGLGSLEAPHALQKAWMKFNVPQCGYCQSGQLMSAAALLDQNPAPTEADVNTAMSGNLCRCGTYPRIRKAILSLAQPASPPQLEPSLDTPALSSDPGAQP
jgi:isoquinoline 1-oxidoreductase alpha subunit